MLIMR